MSKKRKLSVVLHDAAAESLRGVLGPWLMGNDVVGSYIICKEIEPNGPYFHMTVEFPDTDTDFELQIPHGAIKAIICTADLKRFGFAQA